MKFFYIDLVQAVQRTVEDPLYNGKLYHSFERETDGNGDRVFNKINSGLAFESFQKLDPSSAPVLIVIASDSSHHAKTARHPMYCESCYSCYEILIEINIL